LFLTLNLIDYITGSCSAITGILFLESLRCNWGITLLSYAELYQGLKNHRILILDLIQKGGRKIDNLIHCGKIVQGFYCHTKTYDK